MSTRKEVYNVIDHERDFQDKKWGTIEEHPQSLPGWLLIMRKELEEAEDAWANGDNNHEALQELLQVVATGVAALEQHGAYWRDI